MPLKIMTTRNEYNRVKIRLMCPICDEIMEIDYATTKTHPTVCKTCRFVYPNLFVLAKTISPAIGFPPAYRLEKLTKGEQRGFYNAQLQKKEALINHHCDNFDFLPV